MFDPNSVRSPEAGTGAKALIKYGVFKRSLAEAKTINEAAEVRNFYEGIRKHAHRLNDREAEIEAATIAIEAERKLGRLMLAASKAGALAKGGGDQRSKHRGKKTPVKSTLESAGVDKNLAKRARSVGRLTDQEFDERFDLWRSQLNGGDGHIKATLPPLRDNRDASRAKIRANNVSLKEWKELTAAEQRKLLRTTDGEATFNKQDTPGIEWAQWSWNPVTGCLHDCPYCYARDFAQRLGEVYPHGFEPVFRPYMLSAPQNTAVPSDATFDTRFKNVFTCSMADLFGRWVPREWIEAVLAKVEANPQWNFLFLTKFPQRMSEFKIPANAWMGTTVDLQARVANAEAAFERLNSKVGVRWLSVEPMLQPIKFTKLHLFQWVVLGGASRSARTPAFQPPLPWIIDLYMAAKAAGCRIYMKDNLLGNRVLELPFDASIKSDPTKAPPVFHYLGNEIAAARREAGAP